MGAVAAAARLRAFADVLEVLVVSHEPEVAARASEVAKEVQDGLGRLEVMTGETDDVPTS